eukprot:UN06529
MNNICNLLRLDCAAALTYVDRYALTLARISCDAALDYDLVQC